MAVIWSAEKRSEIMSRIRGSDTKLELLVRSMLHRLGWHVVTLWACAVKTRGARDWLQARLPVLIEGKPGKIAAKVAEK